MKIYRLSKISNDSDYFNALENNDLDSLAKLVYHAAKRKGYRHRMWHATDKGDFYTFKPAEHSVGGLGSYYGIEPAIPYDYSHFSKDKNYAEGVVSWKNAFQGLSATDIKSFPVYLKANNVFDALSNEHIYILKEAMLPYQLEHEKDKELCSDIAFHFGLQGEDFEMADNVLYELDPGRWPKGIKSFLEENGFDSFMLSGENNFAVLYPEQIKSALPATFDDNNNLIPLSQRFDETSDDIRY